MKDLKGMSLDELNALQRKISIIKKEKKRKSTNDIPDKIANKLKRDFDDLYNSAQKTWEIKVPIKYVYSVSIGVEDGHCFAEWGQECKEPNGIDYDYMEEDEFCDRHPNVGKYIEKLQKKFDEFAERIEKLSVEYGVSEDDLWSIADDKAMWC